MGNRRILWAIIVSALAVVLFVTGALLTRGGPSVLAQEDPSGRESSAPRQGMALEGPVTQPAEEAIDPQDFGPNAPTAIANFRITGSTLKPRADDVSYMAAPALDGGGCLYASAGNAGRMFNTALSLPNASEILAVRMYFRDTIAGANSVGWFTIYDLYGNIVQEWDVASTGSGGNGYNDTDAINSTINYASFSYAMNWRPYALGEGMQLCGFRIFYEPPPFGVQFLPNVRKP